MSIKHFKSLCTIMFAGFLAVSCSGQNATPTVVEQPTQAALPTSTEASIAPTPNVPTPSPAPGGLALERWIAFLNKNNIWLIRPDGSGLTQVTTNSADNPRVVDFKWSPNGRTLAYLLSASSGSAIFAYDIETAGTQMVVKDDVGVGFDWSPTSKQIIYDTPASGDIPSQQQNKGLWVINLENGKDRQVVEPPPDHPVITDPRWSSEGSHVLFTTPCLEMSCTGQGVANFETGEAVMLPVTGGNCDWSPNDLRIACLRTVPDTASGLDKAELVLMNERGEIAKNFPLPEDPAALATIRWSSDGTRLLLGYYLNGKGQTDTLSAETGERSVLASGLPSGVSTDGQWVLTWESGLNVPAGMTILNLASGESRSLSEGTMPVWQP
jgi:dipeptidyl aminopeptidase/acylaminoacyl peptidase